MYQSVDDDDVSPATEVDQSDSRARRHVIAAVIAGVLLLLAVVLYASLRERPAPEIDPLSVAERQDYLRAIAEPDLALRRARLTDFTATYPQSGSKRAVEAQLAVLDAAEDADWARLTDIAYNPEIAPLARRLALEAYSRKWGPSLLGGRLDDIELMKARLETMPEAPTDDEPPDFTPPPDEFSEDIPDDMMAGAIIDTPRGAYVQPPTVDSDLKLPAERNSPPSIRRRVTPVYPRRALRRNVGARVVLALDIDASGEVQAAELVSVEARRYSRDFVKAAERAAMKMRYFPQTINGEAVATRKHFQTFGFEP